MAALVDDGLSHVQAIWRCRYFWATLVANDLRTRYRRSVLGIGWSIVQPMAMTAVLCLAFHRIFGEQVSSYAPFLIIGMTFWSFISSITHEGCHCFYRAEGYIRSHSAPLSIYPLRAALGQMIHFVLMLGVSLMVTAWFLGLPRLDALLLLVPATLLLAIAGWATAVLMGIACVYFPDVQHLNAVVLQMLFYLTPIMYPPQVIQERGISELFLYNPLTYWVELLRAPLIYGEPASLAAWLVTSVMTAILFALAVGVLAKLQNHIIFHL